MRVELSFVCPAAGAASAARVAAPALVLSSDSASSPRTVSPGSSLGRLSQQSGEIRCPFWRTRAYDALEAALAVANFVAARHKSILDRQWLPGSDASLFAPLALPVRPMGEKTRGLSVEEVMAVVREDIEARGYYVTGRLTQAVYSDGCYFDAPDPDMPVKYTDALRGLFDPSLSAIELIELERAPADQAVPRRDAAHSEEWSLSALEAFASTAWPSLGAPPAPEAGVLQRDADLWRRLRPEPPPPRLTRRAVPLQRGAARLRGGLFPPEG
ncbi:hypothetical protein EMIHUDRAFT_120586 [Emiliania huxleyi CCMP1516]|uniref:Uncharacterized protein n=2 Tax=Emiliania huxleyi TaxID=2903 RepID=A0A0D3IGH0_EMIH1|nr:hypothetical protein EMIHUDRAFT_120586 [Emiliania huxleyi CCMP1516]EOD10355.1 hypothetical protein EMIHUDRAFT_120586 [Emiliania huxleyi CCMP1516]|eukprot:XP_005762784.1 hypothetical protein EMIHUDRAFT_120586 [Emiliania huxleyi CCMP1516]